MTPFDVVIIGGGLSGLAAARAAARQGVKSLALLEGKGIGSNNPSPLTFADVLQQHGLADLAKDTYSRFTFRNHLGSSITWDYDSHPLAVLKYKEACERFLAETQSTVPRFALIRDWVVDLEQSKELAKVTLKGGEEVVGRVAIDASGRRRLSAGRSDDRSPVYYNHVYGAYFSGVEGAGSNECGFVLPNGELGTGGGWYYSIGGGAASFGTAQVSTEPKPDHQQLKRLFRRALAESHPYCRYLERASIESVEMGSIPLNPVQQLVDGRFLRVGDAAGIATNWTCMGTEPCLRYGELAGRLAAEASQHDEVSRLQEFQQTWDRRHRRVYSQMAKMHSFFWQLEHGAWEWIIRNDLRHLSHSQILSRIRANGHVPSKPVLLWRALTSKVRGILNQSSLQARHETKSLASACAAFDELSPAAEYSHG